MRPLVRAVLLLAASPAFGSSLFFHVIGDDHGAWPSILSSIGLRPGPVGPAGVIVIPSGAGVSDPEQWIARAEQGAIVIVEGDSPVARLAGLRASGRRMLVRSGTDVRAPKLQIVWRESLELPAFEAPKEAQVFTRERWTSSPLVAGLRKGKGALLWLASSPGEHGYDRYPYLLQALADLGLSPPLRSRRLWAFFDSSYRLRADAGYLARRWHDSGIAALHVAAWHYWEPGKERDAYLARLIEACHSAGIQVYAWLEFPHVSEAFWNAHPEWREKTGLGQDAHLDWRKLMNLTNREAFRAVADGFRRLVTRFDWDGVNLAELYFESLEGIENPARFTPMNDDVRREFTTAANFDPLDLFSSRRNNAQALKRFLDFRSDLARRQQEEWVAEIDKIRRERPYLDLVLTHVDDRFDSRMRDLIGADAGRLLPLLERHDFTFLIEDPATIWHLGPKRYLEIATRYKPLTRAHDKLAIDINIVERYQDVYPTKQQTGTELFQLVNLAARAFPRIALYFENSILKPDLPLLSSAAAAVERVDRAGGKLVIEAVRPIGVRWQGPALVDGKPWPVRGSSVLWLPAGAHSIESGGDEPVLRLEDLNGDLRSARVTRAGIEFTYTSSARAYARFSGALRRLEIDGVEERPTLAGEYLVLPKGQHLITVQ